MLGGASELKRQFLLAPDQTLQRSFLVVYFVLLICGIIGIGVRIDALGYERYGKHVFPFSEPSHYMLAFGLVTMPLITSYAVKAGLFFIASMIFISIGLGSLIGLIYACLGMLLLSFRLPLTALLCVCSVPITLVIMVNMNADFLWQGAEYYVDRLNFNRPYEMLNLTTLSWLQGLHLASVNLIETKGFGLGLQALGSSTTVLPDISEVIRERTLTYKNINDGSFVAAKLIAEFGVVGLFMIFLYIRLVIRALFILRACHFNLEVISQKKMIGATIVVTFGIELFFRGYGYFSPGVLIFLAAMDFFQSDKIVDDLKQHSTL